MFKTIWKTLTGNYRLLLSIGGVGIAAIGIGIRWYFRKQPATITNTEIDPNGSESSFDINLQQNALSKDYQSIYNIKPGAITILTCDLKLVLDVEITESMVKTGEIITIQRESESFKISFKKKKSSQETEDISILIIDKNQLPTLLGLEFDGQILDKDLYQDVYEQIYILVNAQRGYVNKHSHFLGKGNFGEVWKAYYRNKAVALKEIDFKNARYNLKSEEEAMEDFEWELSRLSALSHPNIVQFYGVYRQSNKTYLVMEYCAGGSLERSLQEQSITWAMRWQWALEIAQAVAYLHHQGVIHRDLKAENILIDECNCARLADLGVAQVDVFLEQQESTSVHLGEQDTRFIAPEQLGHHAISNPKTDVYALGLVFWQLVTGQAPRRPTREIFELPERETIPQDCLLEIRQLILNCWHTNSKDRPSADDIVTRLKTMGRNFNQSSSFSIQLCGEVDVEIHSARIEGLKYIRSYLTENQVLEDLDTYWQRLEVQSDFEVGLSQQESQTSDIGNPLLDFDKVLKDFLAEEESGTLLLLGESGLGKTFSVYQFVDNLLSQWWKYIKEPTTLPSYYPLFIRTKLDRWSYSELTGAIDKIFHEMSKKHEEPLESIRNKRWLVIVDGYDECQIDITPQNLPEQMGLNQLTHVKLLVTCRLDTVESSMLSARFVLNGRLTTRYFLPFHIHQMLRYLKNALQWDKKTYEQYQETISKATELRQILRNPFVLSLLVQSWETISQNKKDLTQLNRWQIYQGFTEHWIKHQQFLLLPSIQKTLSQGYENLLDSFNALASEIAFEAFKKKSLSFKHEYRYNVSTHANLWLDLREKVTEHSRKTFALRKAAQGNARRALLNEEDFATIMRLKLRQFELSSPLKRRNASFDPSHKSFLEYFIARRIIELRREERANIFKEGLQLLNARSLQEEPETLRFMVEAWQEPKTRELQEPFVDIILKSREEYPDVSLAASNAITFLNAAKVSFSGMDLSGIKIPGADLSYGIFDQARLQQANLTQVNFQGAWLRQCDLTEALMLGVNFGELPYFELPKIVSSLCYSSDGRLLAVASGSEIYLYEAKTRVLDGILIGHTAPIESIAFSLDGRFIVSGGGDKTVRLWECARQRLLAKFEGHTESVCSVAFSPDGTFVASAAGKSNDSVIRLWECAKQQLFAKFDAGLIRSIAFSPNGKFIVLGGVDTNIKIWENETQKLSVLPVRHANVNIIAFSPDGRFVVSAGIGTTIRLWKFENWQLLATLEGHANTVNSVAFSPDNKIIAAGSADRTVCLWECKTQKLLAVLEGHSQDIRSVAFSTDNKTIASGSFDRTVRLWESEIHRLMPLPSISLQPYMNSAPRVAFSPDGKLIALGGGGGYGNIIRLLERESCRLIAILEGPPRSLVKSIAFSPDSRIIASGGQDESVRLWESKTQRLLAILEDVALRADNELIRPRGNETILLQEPKKHSQPHQPTLTPINRPLAWIQSIALSRDGKFIVSGSMDGVIRLWNCQSYQFLNTLKGHTSIVESVAFNPTSNLIASCSRDGTVRLWEPESQQPLGVLGHGTWLNSVTFSPDGELIASGGYDKNVWLWESKTQQLLFILIGHTAPVHSVTFSPDGKIIASGGQDKTVRLWDKTTRECLTIIYGFCSIVQSIAFSEKSTGLFLVTGSDDNVVRYWKIEKQAKDTCARLIWTSHQASLCVKETVLKRVKELSELNITLLKQRGAIDELYEAGSHPLVEKFQEKARAALQRNNITESINAYEGLIKITAQCQSAYHDLGCCYFAQGILEQNLFFFTRAEKNFQKAMELSYNSGICTEYANFLFFHCRYEEAIPLLLEAIKLKEDGKELQYGQMEKNSTPEELRVEIGTQSSINIKAFIFAYYLLILIYQKLDKVDQATALLSEYSKEVENIKNAISFSLLSCACKLVGLFNEATIYFNKAHQLKNDLDSIRKTVSTDSISGLIISRKELKNINISQFIENHVSFALGLAVDDGGCFFDALAQALNVIQKGNQHSEKSLRMRCHQYYSEHQLEVDTWNKKDYGGIDKGQEYFMIQYTKAELDQDFHGRAPIWGRPDIEGKILCRTLEIETIIIIEILEDPETQQQIPSFGKVTTEGEQGLDGEIANALIKSQKFPILVNSQKQLHFVPLLPNPTLTVSASLATKKFEINDTVLPSTSTTQQTEQVEKIIRELIPSSNTRSAEGSSGVIAPITWLRENSSPIIQERTELEEAFVASQANETGEFKVGSRS